MISLNTVNDSAQVAAVTQNSQASDAKAQEQKPKAEESSVVVELQGTSMQSEDFSVVSDEEAQEGSSFKVDSSNAEQVVADIVAMLSGSGMGVQANVNSFDASRLLA